MSVGENLKRIRKAKGLTQVDLSKKTGIGQNTISSIERGVNQPIQATLTELAAALGCTVSELMGEKEKRNVPGVMLSDEDLDLLRVFHQLSPAGKAIVQATAEATLRQAEMRQETGTASAG